MRWLLLIAALAAPVCASAAEPKSVDCSFKSGSAHAFEKGAFKAEPASPIAFALVEIDATAQTAKLKTDKGESGVRVVRAVNALHFLEVIGEGFLNIATVYDKDTATAAHPAVHSRHFGLLGQPIVSHYLGSCLSK